MQTYDVDFRTDADYAVRQFKARSPKAALKKALAFYDKRTEELMFMSYDGGHPVNEIAVFDRHGDEVAGSGTMPTCACASPPAICWRPSELSRLDDGTPSVSALDQVPRVAIAEAKGGNRLRHEYPAGTATRSRRHEWRARRMGRRRVAAFLKRDGLR